MTSVSTQVDRGRGSPVERTSLRLDLILSTPSAGVLNVREAKSVPLLVKNEERVREMLSMTPPPLSLVPRPLSEESRRGLATVPYNGLSRAVGTVRANQIAEFSTSR